MLAKLSVSTLFMGGSVLALVVSTPALAQDTTQTAPIVSAESDSAPDSTGEIIVTAQKRASSVEKLPATVNVVSGETLQNLRVNSFDTLNGLVPGLSFERSSGGNSTLAIRGVGTTSSGQTLEQSVAAYINGVYMGGNIREFSTPLYDIEQIEVLSGTQSGIAGQNTSVGSINIVTKKPGDSFGGYLRAGHEFSFDGWNAEGAVDLPASEDLKVRLTGFYDKTDGWLKNLTTGTRPGRGRTYSGRVNAVLQASDAVKISVYGQYDNGRRVGTPQVSFGDPSPLVLALQPGLGRHTTEVVPFSSRGISGEEYVRYNTLRGAFTVDVDLGGPTLTSVTAGTRIKDQLAVDLDQSPADGQWLQQSSRYTQYHQELRLVSPSGGDFSYILGAWYRHAEQKKLLSVFFDVAPLTPLFQADLPFIQKVDTLSAFGDLQYKLTDKLTLGGTLRYTGETKKSTFESISSWPFVFTAFPRTATKLTPSFLDGSVKAQYQITDTAMLYALYAHGTKTGSVVDLAASVIVLKPEKADTFEVGAKVRIPDSRLSLSASLFRMNITDYQDVYAVIVGGFPSFIGENRDLHTQGVQFSADWRATSDFTMGMTGAYMDSHDKTAGGDGVRVPRWSLAANARYEVPLSGWSSKLSFFGNATYKSSYFNKPATQIDPFGLPGGPRLDNSIIRHSTVTPKYALVDLGVELKHDNGLSVKFLVKNVTNTYTHLAAEEVSGDPMFARGIQLPLRQFYLTLGYDF